MRSATAPTPAETLTSRAAAPQNASLRIIGPAHIDAVAGSVLVGAVALGDDPDALGLQAQGNDLSLEVAADLLERTDCDPAWKIDPLRRGIGVRRRLTVRAPLGV